MILRRNTLQHTYVFRAFITACFLFGLSQASAARFINLKHHKSDPFFNQVIKHSPQTHAISATHFHTLNTHKDLQHTEHARVQQYYEGFPVFGAYAIVHTLKTSTDIEGKMYDNLPADLGPIPALFNENAETALARFIAKFPDGTATEGTVKPIIFVDKLHKAHWAYQLSVLLIQQSVEPERPTVIVDANTEEILFEWNNIKTLFNSAHALGYGGNPNTGKIFYGSGQLPPLEIERHARVGWCRMETPRVRIVDMQNHYSNNSNLPIAFRCPTTQKHKHQSPISNELFWTGKNHDGTDTSNGAVSPSNDALFAGEQVYKMYKDWANEYVLTNNNKPAQLVMRVHYGYQYENAFWDGETITFGDGASIFYPLVSIGLAAHELSHGFTEQHSDLNFFGEAGGINEAFSDMASQAAETYTYGKASFTIGAEIIKNKARFGAIRYMEQPSLDGHSIDDASQYHIGMNPHFSSGVYNRMFFILTHQPGWDVQKAFQVMIKANMDYWLPTTTYQSGACGIRSAARDLHEPLEEIDFALTSVGLHPEQCDAPSQNTNATS